MGNCQGIDSRELLLQHPNGKIDKMYTSITAGEVMKMNPGHYVSLVFALPSTDHQDHDGTIRFTRVKLLRRNDYLMLGQAYRLVASHEVMKILRAKRHAKMTSIKPESRAENQASTSQVSRHERILAQRMGSSSSSSLSSNVNVSTLKSKPWQPSLQSITETTDREVMKILRAKRHAKMTSIKPESRAENQASTSQVSRHERILAQRMGSSSSSSLSSNVNVSTLKSKPWQPSLQSITETTDRGCFGGHNSVYA